MSLFRSLVCAALRHLEAERHLEGNFPRDASGAGQANAHLLPPPRAELGFPSVPEVYGQPIERGRALRPVQAAPPPAAWETPPPPRRRRRKVVIEEWFFEEKGW